MSSLAEKVREASGRFGAGDIAGAERLCGEILKSAPGHPEALHLLGVVRLVGGDAANAISLIGQALEASPQNATLLEHLGVAHLAAGEPSRAEAAFRRALERGPAQGLLHMRLGLALGAQGRLEEAVTALRAAAARSPGEAEIHLNLGNALAGRGEFEEALACYRKVLSLHPGHAAARHNIGNAYREMGQLDEAAAAFKEILAAGPNDPDTHNNLGVVYERQQRLDEAAACYRKALGLSPRHVPACNNLGNVLAAQGQGEEAVRWFRQAISFDPSHPDAYVNLGNLRAGQGAYEEALALYHQALGANPRTLEAHLNLGRIYLIRGELAAAGENYARAIAMAPRHPDAHFNLAEVCKAEGRLDQAIAGYQRTLELNPDYPFALGGLVHLRQHICDWEGMDELWERLHRRIAADAIGSVSPFGSLSLPTTPDEQLAVARAWAQRELGAVSKERMVPAPGFPARRDAGRLSVGYLSWGFHRHATAHLAAGLFELHDRARFEVFAYAYGPDDGSAIRARIRSAAEHFVDVSAESHLATAKRIRDDGIDVLVDLTGYTLGARPQILALRPAPVQVNWLGYPGTMGTECVDYLIADRYVIPEGQESGYAETVIRLLHCYQLNDRDREVDGRTPPRGELGLPEQGFVFCCFNQAYKVLPDTFSLWMRILRAVPESVLWLAEANRWATENLRREAAARGVTPERLVFAPRKPLSEYLAFYRAADLALDTFPYTSHTTASDALWMGCPLVTRAGDTFASRVAASILAAGGLAQCIARSPEEYERLAIDLATSRERLAALRRGLAEARDTCPLFDARGLVRDLEAAYDRMVRESRE